MADFTVVPTSGVTVVDWLDPGSSQPSRLNSKPGFPQKRYVGKRGVPVVLRAVVGGVVGPADASLGGRLFVAWPLEAPVMPFGGLVPHTAGYSSIVQLITSTVGHYTIGFRRPSGGIEHVHVDIG